MKFIVHSRYNMMAAIPPETPWAVISVCEKGDFPEIQANSFMKGRLNLRFHDADGGFAYEQEDTEIILFDEAHAQQILEFYENMVEKGVEIMFVHCLMGQSRSAAIAAALEKTFNGDDGKYFSNGPYKPNMLVFRTTLNEAHERGHI